MEFDNQKMFTFEQMNGTKIHFGNEPVKKRTEVDRLKVVVDIVEKNAG